MKTMEIKTLDISNIEQIYEIEQQQFKDESWSLSQLKQGLLDNNYLCVGLFYNQNLCSYVFALQSLDDINILIVATKQNHKQKGYAKTLINYVIDVAKQLNKTVSLEVKNTNNPAISLYNGCGFKTVHVRKAYYKDKSDALIMFYN